MAWHRVPRLARQIGVGLVGLAVVAVGLAMVVLPGPAIVVLPLGLALLATEFAWARRLLQWSKARMWKLKDRVVAPFHRSATKPRPRDR